MTVGIFHGAQAIVNLLGQINNKFKCRQSSIPNTRHN